MFPATPAAKLRKKAKYNEVAPNLNTFAVADAGASATPPLALDTEAGRPAGVRENALKRAAEMLAAAKQEKAAAEANLSTVTGAMRAKPSKPRNVTASLISPTTPTTRASRIRQLEQMVGTSHPGPSTARTEAAQHVTAMLRERVKKATKQVREVQFKEQLDVTVAAKEGSPSMRSDLYRPSRSSRGLVHSQMGAEVTDESKTGERHPARNTQTADERDAGLGAECEESLSSTASDEMETIFTSSQDVEKECSVDDNIVPLTDTSSGSQAKAASPVEAASARISDLELQLATTKNRLREAESQIAAVEQTSQAKVEAAEEAVAIIQEKTANFMANEAEVTRLRSEGVLPENTWQSAREDALQKKLTEYSAKIAGLEVQVQRLTSDLAYTQQNQEAEIRFSVAKAEKDVRVRDQIANLRETDTEFAELFDEKLKRATEGFAAAEKAARDELEHVLVELDQLRSVSAQHQREKLEALTQVMSVKLTTKQKAVKLFVSVMTRTIKGLLSWVLLALREGASDFRQAVAKTEMTKRAASLLMKQALSRLIGESVRLAMCNWVIKQRSEVTNKIIELKRQIEARDGAALTARENLKLQLKHFGASQVCHVLARLVKGETAGMIATWRRLTEMACVEKELRRLDAVRRFSSIANQFLKHLPRGCISTWASKVYLAKIELVKVQGAGHEHNLQMQLDEALAKDALRKRQLEQTALHQLSHILLKMMLEAEAMSLLSWRQNMMHDVESSYRDAVRFNEEGRLRSAKMKEMLESEIRTNRKDSAVALLVAALRRMWRGLLATIVTHWYAAWKQDMHTRDALFFQAEIDSITCDAKRGSALRLMAQAAWSIVKGIWATHVIIWRQRMRVELLLEIQEGQKDAIGVMLREQNKRGGMRLLKHTVASVLKGELGLRLQIWRMARKDSVYAKDALFFQAEIDSITCDAKRGSALRLMAQAAWSIVKGIWATHVIIWRQNMRVELMLKIQEGQKDAIGVMLREQNKRGGMRLLKHTVASVLKGELGLRLQIWRMARKDSDYDQGFDYLQDKLEFQAKRLEAKLKDERHNGAIMLLSNTFRGVLGMVSANCLQVWRQQMRQHDIQAVVDLRSELELRIALQSRASGLRMLKQVFAWMLQQEVGLRIQIWRIAVKDEEQDKTLDFVEQSLRQGALKDKQGALHTAALRRLKMAMMSIAKVDLATRVLTWQQEATVARHEAHLCRIQQKLSTLSPTVGINALRHVLWHILRGKVGDMLTTWRVEARRSTAEQLDMLNKLNEAKLRAEIESRLVERDGIAEAKKGGASRLLVRTWCHMIKGEVAMRLLIWRQEMSIEAHALTAAMKNQIRALGSHAGLHLLRSVVAYMLHGEVGLCVAVWKASQQDDRANMNMTLLQNELEERTANTAKGASLRLLRLSLAYIRKGELGFRIRRWRDKMMVEVRSKARVQQLQLEQELRCAAVREIRWVFTRAANCEASERLARWLFRARRWRVQLHALREVQRCVHRMLKGEVSLCVFTWIASMQRELSEEPLNEAVLESAMLKLQAEKAAMTEGVKRRTQLQATAVNRLRRIAWGMVKGEVSMRLMMWHRSVPRVTDLEVDEDEYTLLTMTIWEKMRLLTCLHKMLRGQRGRALDGMRANLTDSKRMVMDDGVARLLASATDVASLARTSKGAAIRLLKSVAKRMVRGESSECIENWRTSMRMARLGVAVPGGHMVETSHLFGLVKSRRYVPN